MGSAHAGHSSRTRERPQSSPGAARRMKVIRRRRRQRGGIVGTRRATWREVVARSRKSGSTDRSRAVRGQLRRWRRGHPVSAAGSAAAPGRYPCATKHSQKEIIPKRGRTLHTGDGSSTEGHGGVLRDPEPGEAPRVGARTPCRPAPPHPNAPCERQLHLDALSARCAVPSFFRR